jgi:hypothetical protein
MNWLAELKDSTRGLDFDSLGEPDGRDEWLKSRIGKFTASQASRLMGYEDKPEFPKGAMSYVEEVVIGMITDFQGEGFKSASMQHGNDSEVGAVLYFQEKTGLEICNYGSGQKLIEKGKDFSCTPDGLIYNDEFPDQIEAGTEIKCPNTKTHLFYIENIKNQSDLKKHKDEYYWQIQFSLWATGAKKWYFISFDPRIKYDHLKMHYIEVLPNLEDIRKLRIRLSKAVIERDKKLKDLNVII